MKRRSILGGALALAGMTILLAGCAAPSVAPTHSPSSTSPTPTPTLRAATAPGSRVPLGCADLVGVSNIQTLSGANAKVERDEHSAPTDMYAIAGLQYGAEHCVWDGGYGVPGSTSGAYLSVGIAPEGKADFESQFASLMALSPDFPHAAATENVAGDQSGFWCADDLETLGADGPSVTCDAEMRVDDYWVSIDVGDVVGLTRPQLTTGLTATLTRIASRLKAAAPVALPWKLPASTPPRFCTATAITVRSPALLGLRDRYDSCHWVDDTYGTVDFDLLAGGSWAVATMNPVASGDADYGRVPYVAIQVPGVTSAQASCDGTTCDAYLAVGTSAVEIVYDDPGEAKNPALLAALAKAVAAS